MTHQEKTKSLMDGVPDYRTADAATREIMDGIIDQIDPYDINSIFAVCLEPMQRMGEIAEQVMRRSGTEGAIMNSLDELQHEISSINISDLAGQAMGMGAKGIGWVVKNPGTAAAAVAAGTFLSPLAFVGLPIAKAGLDKVNAMRNGEDVAGKLRSTIAQAAGVVEKLETAGAEIPKEIEAINELGRARAEAYRDVSICIGALVELQRRLDKEKIPALQENLENGNYEDVLNLQTLQMSSEQLAEKINAMLASRLVSQAAMVTLMRLKGVFAQAAGKIQTHLAVSVPQWKIQIAEAGVALAANKATEAIAEADRFGTKVLTEGAAVANRTAQMMARSARAGTYDPQKLVSVLQDLTKSLEADVRQIGDRKKDLEADRQRLVSAAASFRERVAAITAQAEGRMALPQPDTKLPALEGPR